MDAAEADDDERTKAWFLFQAEKDFSSAGRRHLDRHRAIDTRIGRVYFDGSEEVFVGDIGLFGSDAEEYAADIGFVDDIGRGDLECDRRAELGCEFGRFLARSDEPAFEVREAIRGEKFHRGPFAKLKLSA